MFRYRTLNLKVGMESEFEGSEEGCLSAGQVTKVRSTVSLKYLERECICKSLLKKRRLAVRIQKCCDTTYTCVQRNKTCKVRRRVIRQKNVFSHTLYI